MNIYVGNISNSVSEQDLIMTFSKFGPVKSAKLIADGESGRAMGFGFVEMENKKEAIRAIGQLHGTKMDNLTLIVNASRSSKPVNRLLKAINRE